MELSVWISLMGYFVFLAKELVRGERDVYSASQCPQAQGLIDKRRQTNTQTEGPCGRA